MAFRFLPQDANHSGDNAVRRNQVISAHLLDYEDSYDYSMSWDHLRNSGVRTLD